MGALLPAWQSLGPQTGSGWGMVCTSTEAGPRRLATPTSPSDDAPAAHTPCPYCLLQHLAWAPPPQTLALVLPSLAKQPTPLALTQAQRPRAASWLRPPPHAPPQARAPAALASA